MPELAEVEFYRKQWDCGIGQTVDKVHLNGGARIFRETNTRKLRKSLPGSAFQTSECHGKQMLFGFTPEIWLAAHLGMTGQLLVMEASYQPEKHDHLVIFQPNQSLVFRDSRKFGRIRFDQGTKPPTWWSELPPQPISPEFTADRVTAFLARHPKSVIKALLLDQAGFPGIGNWMADEVLWRIRLHPATRCREIPRAQAHQLRDEVRKLSLEALSVIGTDWSDPPDSWLFNHRWKDGGICPRGTCKTPLIREDLRGRTTCWCPNCQVAT